jgi:predicted dehydrogenase
MSKRCVIVGLGKIGMGYDITGAAPDTESVFSHAKAFSLHPGFWLQCAVDPSNRQREIFDQHFGLPAYPDVEHAASEGAADVVVIASPTQNHFSVVCEVLSRLAPKAILCEKPLAYSLTEAQSMVEACESSGVQLYVNYMRRSDPGVIEVKNRIESGSIATPLKGIAWYSKGFLHNGSHFFNLLEYWLGDFVSARILNSGRILECEDCEPDVQVEFKRGAVVFLAAWEEAYSHYTIELLSQSGRLRYEQGGELITWQSAYDDPNFPGYKILRTAPDLIANDMGRYQWNVVDQLANALENRPSYLCTGREALATLNAMHQILKLR